MLLLAMACGGGPSTPADDTAPGDAVPMIDEVLDLVCPDVNPARTEPEGTEMWRVSLDDPEAMCNDGTPGVMYVRASTGGAAANQWVLYFQGGSACGDLVSCAERWCGAGKHTKSKMSSAWTEPSSGTEALLERDGTNPLGEANQVVFHYCSSDAWSGTRADVVLSDEENYPDQSYRLHFRGHDIARAALAQLLAGPVSSEGAEVTVPSLADAEVVVVAGSSAGASGAERHVDWLAAQLPDARVVGWFDANAPPTYDDLGERGPELYAYDRDVRWPEVYDARYGMAIEESCGDAHLEEDRWLCGNLDHLLLHHITTPFFVRQDLRDAVVGERYLQNGATASELATAWRLTLDRLHEVRDTGEEGKDVGVRPGVYAPNCGQHVGMSDASWLRETTVTDGEGQAWTHLGAFGAWFGGAAFEVLDTEPRSASVCAATTDGGG